MKCRGGFYQLCDPKNDWWAIWLKANIIRKISTTLFFPHDGVTLSFWTTVSHHQVQHVTRFFLSLLAKFPHCPKLRAKCLCFLCRYISTASQKDALPRIWHFQPYSGRCIIHVFRYESISTTNALSSSSLHVCKVELGLWGLATSALNSLHRIDFGDKQTKTWHMLLPSIPRGQESEYLLISELTRAIVSLLLFPTGEGPLSDRYWAAGRCGRNGEINVVCAD